MRWLAKLAYWLLDVGKLCGDQVRRLYERVRGEALERNLIDLLAELREDAQRLVEAGRADDVVRTLEGALGAAGDKVVEEVECKCVQVVRDRWFWGKECPVALADELKKAFCRFYGINEDEVMFIAYDNTYGVAPSRQALEEWVQLDWTNMLSYIPFWFDCDNFAALFAARTRMLTGWAATFTCGEIRRKDNGELIGYHAWVTLYYKEGDQIKAIAFEPQDDTLSEDATFAIYDEDGKPIEVVYRPIAGWPQTTC